MFIIMCGSAAVCGSTLGSSVWQCTSVRQRAAVYGSVRQCPGQCAAVHAPGCGSGWQCVAVRMAVSGSALRVFVYTQSLRTYIGMPSYRQWE
jgi:hypothetical protein